MKLIPLSQYGKYKGKFFTKVDDEDFEYLNQWKWHVMKSDKNYYVGRACLKTGKPIQIKMHRLLMNVTDPKIFIDHKDHDGLNNQKSNLRKCNLYQNAWNRTSKINSRSQYLGVYLKIYTKTRTIKNGILKIYPPKTYYSWTVYIQNKFVGSFKTEKEAALAYNEAAKKNYGEFANLNKV